MRAQGASFRDFVLDQLEGLGDVESRAMFGGYGLYSAATFFGILYRGRLFFRTDETTQGEYLDRGMEPFRPRPRQELGSYYEVPPEVLEDPSALARWARAAVQAKRGSAARVSRASRRRSPATRSGRRTHTVLRTSRRVER